MSITTGIFIAVLFALHESAPFLSVLIVFALAAMIPRYLTINPCATGSDARRSYLKRIILQLVVLLILLVAAIIFTN